MNAGQWTTCDLYTGETQHRIDIWASHAKVGNFFFILNFDFDFNFEFFKTLLDIVRTNFQKMFHLSYGNFIIFLSSL